MIVLLVLAILVVGNFLRDGKSNYLEGALLVVSVIFDNYEREALTEILDCLPYYYSLQLVLS